MIALLRLLWRLLAVFDLTVASLVMVTLALLPRSLIRRVYPPLFQIWCRTFIRALGVELRLHQHQRRALPKQFVLIANHPSAFEDLGIPALFRARSLAKAEVADWWLVGRIATAADTLYVRRESSESRKTATLSLINALRQGDNIALYPEGGCKGRRLSGRFFNGAFVASFETGVPILPVFLHYQAQEDFEWGDQHLIRKIWELATLSNPRADYHLFDPIDPAHFDSAEALKEHCYRLYQQWQARFLE